MVYQNGKAISGGRDLTPAELQRLSVSQLEDLRSAFSIRQPTARSDDAIDQRLAEELRSAKRLIESLEDELFRRGQSDKRLEAAEDIIEDVASVVEAENDCDAIAGTSDDFKRRVLRRSIDGKGTRCDNRGK